MGRKKFRKPFEFKAYRAASSEKSVKNFDNREQALAFMKQELFDEGEFQRHTVEVSQSLNIDQNLVKDILEKFFSELTYEIDRHQHKRKKTRIIIPSFLLLELGYLYGVHKLKYAPKVWVQYYRDHFKR